MSADEQKRLQDLFALMHRLIETHAAYVDPRSTRAGQALSDAEVEHFVAQCAQARLQLERALLAWEDRAGKLYELIQSGAESARGRSKKSSPGVFAASTRELWIPSTDRLWDAAVSRCERCFSDPHAFDGFAQAIQELVALGAVTQAMTDARLKRALAGRTDAGRDGSHALDLVAAVTGVAKNKIVAARARAVGRSTAQPARERAPVRPAEPADRRREQNARLVAEAIERGKQRARERATHAGPEPTEPKPE